MHLPGHDRRSRSLTAAQVALRGGRLRAWIRTAGCLLFLTGYYTQLSFPFAPNRPIVPYVGCFVGAVILALVDKHWTRRSLTGGAWLLVYVFVSVVSSEIAAGTQLSATLSATGQLAYSVVAAWLVYVALMRLPREWSSGILGWSIVVVLGLSIAFIALHGAGWFGAFRDVVYGGRGVNVNRDLALHGGFLRPAPFAREPSHVAVYLLLAITAWAATSRRPRRFVIAAGAASCSLIVVRSPILLLSLVNVGILYVWQNPGRGRVSGIAGTTMRLAVAAGYVAIVGLAVWTGALDQRMERIEAGRDPSTAVRVIRPFEYTLQVLERRPLFGVGVGQNERILELAQNGGVPTEVEETGGYLAASLFGHWMYLGLVVGTFGLLTWVMFWRSVGADLGLALVVCCELGMVVGGYYTVQFWAGFALLSVAASCVRRDRSMAKWQLKSSLYTRLARTWPAPMRVFPPIQNG